MSPHKITRMSQHLEQTPGHETNYHANIWPNVIPNPIFEGIHWSNLSLNQGKDPPIQNLLCVISHKWNSEEFPWEFLKRFTVSSCCFHIPTHWKIRVSNWNQWKFSLIIVAHPVNLAIPPYSHYLAKYFPAEKYPSSQFSHVPYKLQLSKSSSWPPGRFLVTLIKLTATSSPG